MTTVAAITLGSAVSGGTAAGTVHRLHDSIVIGAGAVLVYGSGGTAVTAYLQTSFDAEQTWVDVAAFTFGTVAASKYAALGQPAFGTAIFATTDASLSGSALSGVPVGNALRARYTSTGTYTASTVSVYAVIKR